MDFKKLGQSTRKITLLAMIFGFIAPIILGNASAQVPDDWGVAGDIPKEANRIVMEQEGVPSADVYVDALYTLERLNFDITKAEDTMDSVELEEILSDGSPLVFTARKQITEDMAIEISGNVNTIPGGGRLIASVKYADNVDTEVPNWKQAEWTKGKAKEAFVRGLDILRGTRYDAMDFEIGVAIANRNTQ